MLLISLDGLVPESGDDEARLGGLSLRYLWLAVQCRAGHSRGEPTRLPHVAPLYAVTSGHVQCLAFVEKFKFSFQFSSAH